MEDVAQIVRWHADANKFIRYFDLLYVTWESKIIVSEGQCAFIASGDRLLRRLDEGEHVLGLSEDDAIRSFFIYPKKKTDVPVKFWFLSLNGIVNYNSEDKKRVSITYRICDSKKYFEFILKNKLTDSKQILETVRRAVEGIKEPIGYKTKTKVYCDTLKEIAAMDMVVNFYDV